MSAVRHDRNKGRRTAVQLLYASEITGQDPVQIAETGAAPEEVVLDEYALRLIEGVAAEKDAIDAQLEECSRNWAVSRMPLVDKCILRVAVYEMRNVEEVPVAVSINEAVEIAREFGGEDESHRFVNGVLGRIAEGLADGAAATPAAEPAEAGADESDPLQQSEPAEPVPAAEAKPEEE